MPTMPGSQSSFIRRFSARHLLRLHMTCIVLVTVASGVLIARLLFMAHVGNFAIRYPLAVLLSYLVFFGCVKLWLMAMGTSQSADTHSLDVIDLPVGSLASGSGSSADLPFAGGGGGFAGGGASASWANEVGAAEVAACAVGEVAENGASAVGDAGGEAAGAAIGVAGDALGDEVGIVVVPLVILGVVLVAVFGVSAYLIYEAPIILSEVAFQGLMAATLSKRTREMTAGDWVGSVYRATRKPFLLTLGFAAVCGIFLYGYFPDATRIADIF